MSNMKLDFEPRWRAKADEGYWYISRDLQVVRTWDRGKEGLPFKTIDELRNESGNYFSDKEEAEHYASTFRDILIPKRCLHRAGSNGLYYFIDTSISRSVNAYEWTDPTQEDAPGISLYACGNYFLTEEEARNFCTCLELSYRADTSAPNKGTRINKQPRRENLCVASFLCL